MLPFAKLANSLNGSPAGLEEKLPCCCELSFVNGAAGGIVFLDVLHLHLAGHISALYSWPSSEIAYSGLTLLISHFKLRCRGLP